jgi:hypothetical protein
MYPYRFFKIYPLTEEATNYLLKTPNYYINIHQNSAVCYQALPTFQPTVFTSSYPYKEDELAMPGNLLTI